MDSLQSILYIENAKKARVAPGRDLYMTAMLSSSNNATVEDIDRLSSPYPLYYSDILELVKDRNMLKTRLELSGKPVTVLSDFVPIRHVHTDLWYLWPIITSILLTGIIGGCIDYRKSMQAYIKRQRKRE